MTTARNIDTAELFMHRDACALTTDEIFSMLYRASPTGLIVHVRDDKQELT